MPVRDEHIKYYVVRRNRTVVPFDEAKINVAITKAFLATEGESASGSQRVHDLVAKLTGQVVDNLMHRGLSSTTFHVEDIQDQVELALMRGGYQKVSRAYVLYREQRAKRRAQEAAERRKSSDQSAKEEVPRSLDTSHLFCILEESCEGLDNVSAEVIYKETLKSLYEGMTTEEFSLAPLLTARTFVETEPNYAFVSARLLLNSLRAEAVSCVTGRREQPSQKEMTARYGAYFQDYLDKGIAKELIDPSLRSFTMDRLTMALKPERDLQFDFIGLQTLYDRYLLRTDGVRFELPQAFFMRIAMGLALGEKERESYAIAFYDLLSTFVFMPSTPTLFNSGTLRPQLSSCFLTTVPDNLEGIFKAIKDNALLAKYSGGLGNDWTPVRGMGAHIKGTNGMSQGVIPFLKVANDTAIAVNQGGKRKGAVCAYLETWHCDIEEFLDLRKNTGDDRRRTHDMNTANWIPDLFMERVEQDAHWTLFSPDETANLHELYGTAFKKAYEEYERRAALGEMKIAKRVRAVELWRRMLTMLFETGHPWITFKDPCNIRSPQKHVGVVHTSNLCTEITLNTSKEEVAVCNLGSVNLLAHSTSSGLDRDKLATTVRTAVRMLDNVIDINYYTIPEAKNSNLKHRPVGLGIMGFHDTLQKLHIPYASEEAVAFADESMEVISYHALSASADLADERGAYATFKGSLWAQGVLPIDSIELLASERGHKLDNTTREDWSSLRERIKKGGLRNSNVLAIAPTATISNICGISQSIEPAFQNLYVKSNMSGDFTVLNAFLVRDLRERGLWDSAMISDLKYYDGSLQEIDRVPDDLKALYATAFEIESQWLVRAAACRQKWIDQGQSLNLYIAEPRGKVLDTLYKDAWRLGLKTTYYLRSRSATRVEKSTLKGTDGKLNAVVVQPVTPSQGGQRLDPKEISCSVEDLSCEACQ